MATYVTDDGICLRVTDFSETSQIVGMFTRRHGLVPLIAKGAKRASKKHVMSGPLDLLTGGEVVFVPAREGPGSAGGDGVRLGTLAEWQLSDHRQAIRGNLAALNAAMMCAEVTTHLVHPLDPHAALFGELEAALELLGSSGGGNLARVLAAYVKAALQESGYWPQLGRCLVCGKATGDAALRFSVRAGGVSCSACHAAGGGLTLIVPGKVVAGLERLALPSGLRANPPARAAEEGALKVAMELLLAQVEAVTDKGVRTRELLKGIWSAG